MKNNTINIKGLIFDLDGVIVDTAKYHYLAWKRLAQEMGFHFSEEDNEQLKGVSRTRSLEILLSIGNIKKSEKEMEELAARKNKWYVEYIVKLEPKEILPGVEKFLNELKELRIKTALGSASKNAPLIIKRLNLENYFDVILDGSLVKKPKPNAEVFLKCARGLELKPEECIVFEDAQAGIDAAKNGNMYCVGVGSPENLKGADYIVSGFLGVTLESLIEHIVRGKGK